MRGQIIATAPRHIAAIVVIGIALMLAGLAEAKTGSAELKAVTGRVEVQKKGDSQWAPAVVGTQLVEGDNIRAWAGASARMDLPDGSTIFVAENSRLAIGKLEFDQQNQAREALFYLAVGKVRAVVSQTAVRLVKARQSNFSISTQTAVAAARGTDFEVTYDEARQETRIAVLSESGAESKGDGAPDPIAPPSHERPAAGTVDADCWSRSRSCLHWCGRRRRADPGRHRRRQDGHRSVEIQRKGDTGWLPPRWAPGSRRAIRCAPTPARPRRSTCPTAARSSSPRTAASSSASSSSTRRVRAARRTSTSSWARCARSCRRRPSVSSRRASRTSRSPRPRPWRPRAAPCSRWSTIATQNVMRVAVIVQDPRRAAGLVSCLSLQDRYSNVLVREGLATIARGTSGCAPPIPISLLPDASLVGTLANPIPPGPSFSVPISVPTIPDAGARRPSSSPPIRACAESGAAIHDRGGHRQPTAAELEHSRHAIAETAGAAPAPPRRRWLLPPPTGLRGAGAIGEARSDRVAITSDARRGAIVLLHARSCGLRRGRRLSPVAARGRAAPRPRCPGVLDARHGRGAAVSSGGAPRSTCPSRCSRSSSASSLALGNAPLAAWAARPARARSRGPRLAAALWTVGTVSPAQTARSFRLFLTYGRCTSSW